MELHGAKLYPLLHNHGSRVHLGPKLRVVFGQPVEPICGQVLIIGIGARRVPVKEWETLHESLKCQRCVRAYEAHSG